MQFFLHIFLSSVSDSLCDHFFSSSRYNVVCQNNKIAIKLNKFSSYFAHIIPISIIKRFDVVNCEYHKPSNVYTDKFSILN